MNLEHARFNMIEQQIRPWDVLDQTVLDTFGFIQRELFVPKVHKALAFADVEIPLGHGEHMMFPRVEARMLQALEISPDDTCLEIGTGSGFITACLAHLSKHVDSVDIYEDFTRQAEERLFNLKLRNHTLHTADALRDWSTGKQYNVIAVTGSMPTYLPRFEAQLAPGGRLFVVVGHGSVMQATLIKHEADSEFTRTTLFETQLKALVGTDSDTDRAFVF
ncbi:MAG: protein-L-isoaspartate O-methyltransferase [Candidatus Thiothrix putei]|uniref:Protein-L-isoaspartate O-methyltransferase n=2 Tax=Thiothrix TaxID=1030 RepID=A0A1H3X9S1_9GAMM|nr:protein-L-isoaspartate O-methyltransferase [Thiothrix caldifontis]WGZ94653.1 MAG: protein-L-isoaspartate O-methyltransferase [Candidatus Thiothrix putei]SDZ96145.1 protein-L-isoaspartate(D-aspartate) O-methyltransferase [Thiothrix caldifontis]